MLIGTSHRWHRCFKVWQDSNDAKEIFLTSFLEQKMDYIHYNPVRAEIVANHEEYVYSSCRDYLGEKGLVNIEFV